MKQFKICLLGAPMVGKTSLVQRFVHSRFSEAYHSTIGVKIDKKTVLVDGETVQLIIWDVQGEERYRKVFPSYLRGMNGYFLAVDASRPETADATKTLHEQIADVRADAPFVMLRNKCDLLTDSSESFVSPVDGALSVIETSSKTGQGVEEAFLALTRGILDQRAGRQAA